jgi:transposase InsO family protein
MSLREEFVLLAQQEGAHRRDLCRRYGISPQTAYKWLARYTKEGRAGLEDRSKRPRANPGQTDGAMETLVVQLRQEHPSWGGRKLSRRLQDLGHPRVAPSTITSILHRHGLISPQASEQATPWKRFEHNAPNDLWQMDFKGYFQTTESICHPLTVLDDHSRFNLAIQACDNQRYLTVRERVTGIFQRYGLPVRINTDNGQPWGASRQPGQLTDLAIWLIRQGIRISFSRPYHPQTNGKDERFHRTLKAEVLNGRSFHSLQHAQEAFDLWREIYNHHRPHEALQMATPTSRYRVSIRTYSACLPAVEYGPDDTVVTVKWNGELRFKKRRYKVSNPLRGQPVAIRPDETQDGLYDVFFVHHKLMQIDLRTPSESGA